MACPRLLVLLLSSCLAVSLVGCERRPIIVETVVPEAQLRLMKINSGYNRFIDRFGRARLGENELLPMLATEETAEHDPETVLTSTNGQPFVICYGLNPLSDLTWAKSTPVLAYEQTASSSAVDGKRWVLTAPGAILQLSEVEFVPPAQDFDSEQISQLRLYPANYQFGGPHPGTMPALLCDGSVQSISFSVDAEVFRRLSVRDDGDAFAASFAIALPSIGHRSSYPTYGQFGLRSSDHSAAAVLTGFWFADLASILVNQFAVPGWH